MRNLFFTAALVAASLFTVTPAEGAKPPLGAVAITSAPTHQGWWFEDKDGDGHCAGATTAVNASARPAGMKAKSECAAGDDTDDTNKFVSPSAPVVTSISAEVLAAWTLGKTLAQTNQATPAFAKVKGEVEACCVGANVAENSSGDWLVYKATCDCDIGYRWYSFQDPITFEWSGACDEDRGASGRTGAGGVDSEARKGLEELASKNDAAHAGLVSRDNELETKLTANAEADANAWEQYRAQRRADAQANVRFETEMAEVNTAQDEEIKKAQGAADSAKASVATEATLREAADKNLKTADEDADKRLAALEDADHNTVGITVVGAVQSDAKSRGEILRPDRAMGIGLTYSGFGTPFKGAEWLRVGGDLVAAVMPAERGLSLMPAAQIGFHNRRFGVAAVFGPYVNSAGTIGRESSVIAFGMDGGVKADVVLVDGLTFEGRLVYGRGINSAYDADYSQSLAPDGHMTVGLGLAFVF